MNFKYLFSFFVGAILVSIGCSNSNSDYSPGASFNTMEDSVSYDLGYQYGYQLANQGFPDIGIDNFYAGFKSGLEKQESELKEANLQDLFKRFQAYIIDKIKTENLEEGRVFLAENKTKEGVMETVSGLQYKVIEEGTGVSPTPKDTVVVNYEGTLIDGTVFDSSYEKNRPQEFLLGGGVIPGWTEGLVLMKEGATYMFYIPAELGYGENPRPGGAIQPNDLLIFKIELIEVK